MIATVGERLPAVKAVCDLHVAAAELAHEPEVVIAVYAVSRARPHHVAHDPNRVEDARPAIDANTGPTSATPPTLETAVSALDPR